MKMRVVEMSSSAHGITFNDGTIIVGAIFAMGQNGYTLSCLKEGESSRSGTKKLKRFVKDATKRGDTIFVDSRYIS